MRVSRAKRRLNRWYRYVDRTGTISSNKAHRPYHWGLVKAFNDVMYAQRYAPLGVREPWMVRKPPSPHRGT